MSESKRYRPRKPAGLTGSGLTLWNKVTKDFVLEHHELSILEQMCRTSTRIEQLDAIAEEEGLVIDSPHGKKMHPAAVEARQVRAVFTQLAKALKFPGVEP